MRIQCGRGQTRRDDLRLRIEIDQRLAEKIDRRTVAGVGEPIAVAAGVRMQALPITAEKIALARLKECD